MAQSGYYHQVGDTVRGKCPIYHYEQNWWPTLNAIGHTDSLITTAVSEATGYMKQTTNTPLKVIGIASTLARMNSQPPTPPYEDLDTNIEPAMDYILYDATASGLVEKARVCWTNDYMTHPKRYLELPMEMGSCSEMSDQTTIVSLREYYFDSAITVTDSFYVGCIIKPISIYDGDPNAYETFVYAAFHHWYFCSYGVQERNTDKDCAVHIPDFTYYDSLYDDWVYTTRNRFQLIFPIIEVDTFCVTPDEPQVADRDSLRVRVEWTDSSNLSWEVSRTAPGGDPNTGSITPTTVPYIEYTDIDNDSAYHVYVRGYCETLSSWSDWSTPCFIDSIPTPTTPPTPPEGITTIETADFTLSLNPTSMTVTVETNQPSTLTLTDATGHDCGQWKVGNGKTTLDISSLPAGVYFVRLSTSFTMRKLIIQ